MYNIFLFSRSSIFSPKFICTYPTSLSLYKNCWVANMGQWAARQAKVYLNNNHFWTISNTLIKFLVQSYNVHILSPLQKSNKGQELKTTDCCLKLKSASERLNLGQIIFNNDLFFIWIFLYLVVLFICHMRFNTDFSSIVCTRNVT